MGSKRPPDFVIALDPSGSFKEGKGTTGIATFVLVEDEVVRTEVHSISAKDYTSQTGYWSAHMKFIAECMEDYNTIHVVMEDYRLYGHKAQSQINSSMETIRLIGSIQVYL